MYQQLFLYTSSQTTCFKINLNQSIPKCKSFCLQVIFNFSYELSVLLLELSWLSHFETDFITIIHKLLYHIKKNWSYRTGKKFSNCQESILFWQSHWLSSYISSQIVTKISHILSQITMPNYTINTIKKFDIRQWYYNM